MSIKRQEEAPKGSPAWMATFSDLMNLLLCFFVLLFSMSTMEESKLNELVATMNNSFSIFDAGATAIGEGILISNGVSQLNELDKYINSTGKTAESSKDAPEMKEYENAQELIEAINQEKLQNNEELAEKIEEALEEGNVAEQIEVSFTSSYVQLTIKGGLLFDSGSAQLRPEAMKVMDKAALILGRYAKGTIEIEGHTDNLPMKSEKYADNEELSSARALAVFYYLDENTDLDSTKLRHAGMGDRAPVADNSTPEGRSRNRRVEIRIYNPSGE